MSRRRSISWLMVIVFCFVIFGSSCFIVFRTAHDCSGDSCSVCEELAECHKMLDKLGTAFSCGGTASPVIVTFSEMIVFFSEAVSDHVTLISLKVELLD